MIINLDDAMTTEEKLAQMLRYFLSTLSAREIYHVLIDVIAEDPS